jgi:predicted alpha/beta-fold hydrolase
MIEKYGISFDEIKHIESWKGFDDKFTIKVFPHFRSVPDYYYAGSSLPHVQDIKVPTMVIHSRDDPIIPIECLPVDECVANNNIILGIVNRGGHVCYF